MDYVLDFDLKFAHQTSKNEEGETDSKDLPVTNNCDRGLKLDPKKIIILFNLSSLHFQVHLHFKADLYALPNMFFRRSTFQTENK